MIIEITEPKTKSILNLNTGEFKIVDIKTKKVLLRCGK